MKKSCSLNFLIVFALVFSFLLSSCQLNKGKKGDNNLNAVELPITYSAITYIAKAKGYIEEEELNYQVVSMI